VASIPHIFDRATARRRRIRAAARISHVDFLAARAGQELTERILARGQPVETAVWIGGGRLLSPNVVRTIELDTASVLGCQGEAVIGDEELLPFASKSVDLYTSNLTLHGLNDIPGALVQIRRALRDGGFFAAAMFGGETLKELREAFAAAEIETEGGVSPRVHPFVDVRDAGNLLQRAGFAQPVVDADPVIVQYGHPKLLLNDLQGMGETNVLCERRRRFLKRRTLERMYEIYTERFSNSDGRVRATFQILYLSGRAQFEAQQQPMDPGSRARL
jgi:SAM-dependent methyltransferase